MLRFHNYDSSILSKVSLTGKPLSGLFPWEAQWLVNKARTITGDILEIGTYKGATARELAVAFPNLTIHVVDVHMPSYGLKIEEVCMEAKDLPNVNLTIADSHTFSYPPNLGLIFIDGDHTWEGVRIDTENALSYFRNRHGTIVWHDYDPGHQVMPYLDWFERHINPGIRWVQNTMLAFIDV
jgi:hypothetical protein